MNARPDTLVVVLGTRTEVGKTWVSSQLARVLRSRGLTVAARKPAQSWGPEEELTDADVLAAATGETAEQVCSISYPVPMAPPMAAEALGTEPPSVSDLIATISWQPGIDVGLVETAGGVASPQAGDGDAIDLLEALRPDAALLVADAGLGTINDIRLCVAAIESRLGDPPPVVVLANRWNPDDELHQRNLAWLREHDGIEALVDLKGPLLWKALSSGR